MNAQTQTRKKTELRVVGKSTNSLPVLPEVEVMTSSEIAEEIQKAEETRKWVEAAAEKFCLYGNELLSITSHLSNWKISESMTNKVKTLQGAVSQIEEQVAGLGQGTQDHFDFSVLLFQMKNVLASKSFFELLDDAVDQGRVSIVSKKEAREHSNSFIFGTNGYEFSKPKDGEEKTGAQKLFEYETRRALKKLLISMRKQNEEQILLLSSKGEDNLSDFLKEELGVYHLVVPGRELAPNKTGQQGHILAKIEEFKGRKQVKLLESAGSCHWIRSGVWMPVNRIHTDIFVRLEDQKLHDKMSYLVRLAVKHWQQKA